MQIFFNFMDQSYIGIWVMAGGGLCFAAIRFYVGIGVRSVDDVAVFVASFGDGAAYV
jgi:hypothetical protein